MLTAQEARDLYKAEDERVKKHIKEIEKDIRDNLADGKIRYDMSPSQDLIDPVMEILREAGYSVSWNRAMLGLDISWRA